MQEQKTIQKMFQKIALKLNRSFSDFQTFTKIFKDNWYQTEADIKDLTDEDFEKMKIPFRVVLSIKEELGIKKTIPEVPQNTQSSIPQTPKVQQPKKKKAKKRTDLINFEFNEEQPKAIEQFQETKISRKQNVKQLTQRIQTSCNELVMALIYIYKPKVEPVIKICEVFQKIHENLAKNPYQMKFRTLKKSNKSVENYILQHEVCRNFLKVVGFEEAQETFYVHSYDVKIAYIIQRYMTTFVTTSKNNLQNNSCPKKNNAWNTKRNTDFRSDLQSQVVDLSSHFSSNENQRMKNEQELNEIKALEELTEQRSKMMRTVPEDRGIRIYKRTAQQKPQNIQQIDFQEEFKKSDNQLITSYWKQYIKANQNGSKFRSKRKLQLQFILKQKLYVKTAIRVRLPNDFIIEAFFAPLQTLDSVHKLMSKIVVGECYLFTTPPKKVMKQKELGMNLQDHEAVPTGTFHLGVDGKLFLNKEYKCYVES